MCHVTLTTPHSGLTCRWWATMSVQTKFGVSNYTHYEDMKSGAKCGVSSCSRYRDILGGVKL